MSERAKELLEFLGSTALLTGIIVGGMHYSGYIQLGSHFHWWITTPVCIGLLLVVPVWHSRLPDE